MKRALFVTIVGALAAAFLSSTALAGEAKNDTPFTRIVSATPGLSLRGEPKNVVPFMLGAPRSRAVPDWFERYAAAHPYGRGVAAPVSVPVASSAGFHWREALLGAAAATAACLLCVGLVVGRMRRRNYAPGRDPVGA
jgi:hypothetical protein